jgi:hypothetical protein
MVVVIRSVLLLVLVLAALGFSIAVARDQDDGALLDEAGVITPDLIENRQGR